MYEPGQLSQYSDWLRTGTMDWTTGVRYPTEAEDFSSCLCVQTGSEARPASYPMGTRSPFPGVKRGRGVTLTTHPHLVPRLRMSRSYTFSPPMCLHGMYRDGFTFTLLYGGENADCGLSGCDTECRGRVVSTPDSYYLGCGFKLRPGELLSWLRFIVAFLSPSTQMLG
jgi:hypothetical protein